ncbi:MAG: hypothetical protein KVP17_003822, partial [Porospora cf. gigantea B]|uniref:uncharacterized protein n=2 Tax=Porospora cf. gigantea B TaxID=2853592 RepID=UPI003571F65A
DGGGSPCTKGGTFLGYAPPRNPDRDGKFSQDGETITVETAPAKPPGCTANVSLPQAGKSYNFKEYYGLIGKSKLLCAGWDQTKHDHVMRKSKTNGNCTGRDAFTFDNLALAAGMFPDFAGTPHAVTNALEIAAFMANSSKETTGGWASEGYSGWGWCFAYEVGFPATSYGDQSNPNNSNCTSWWGNVTDSLTSQFDVRNKNRGYYGRGAFQLTHCYNYGWFRNWVETYLGLPRVPERDFLSNPGMVVKEWPFVSGMWFWMSPEEAGNKPSMHSITYMWEPNGELSVDNAGRSNDFGYLPNILNGGFECGSSGHHGPKIRVDYMAEYMEQMGVDTSQYQKQLQIDGGCVGKSNMASQTFKFWKHPDGSKDKGDILCP